MLHNPTPLPGQVSDSPEGLASHLDMWVRPGGLGRHTLDGPASGGSRVQVPATPRLGAPWFPAWDAQPLCPQPQDFGAAGQSGEQGVCARRRRPATRAAGAEGRGCRRGGGGPAPRRRRRRKLTRLGTRWHNSQLVAMARPGSRQGVGWGSCHRTASPPTALGSRTSAAGTPPLPCLHPIPTTHPRVRGDPAPGLSGAWSRRVAGYMLPPGWPAMRGGPKGSGPGQRQDGRPAEQDMPRLQPPWEGQPAVSGRGARCEAQPRPAPGCGPGPNGATLPLEEQGQHRGRTAAHFARGRPNLSARALSLSRISSVVPAAPGACGGLSARAPAPAHQTPCTSL